MYKRLFFLDSKTLDWLDSLYILVLASGHHCL